jgi:hypothetical protein
MSNTKKVEEFMANLEHPLKTEMEAVRAIIFYKEELATFNPRIKNYVALIFHKGELLNIKSDFLEEASKGKVYAKFHSIEQVTANKELIEKMVNTWIELMDK